MANFVHFSRRTYELKHQKEILVDLSQEVDLFIRKTDKHTLNNVKIEFDSEKFQEIKTDLENVKKLIDIYSNQVHRASRVKIKRWEQQTLRGHRDEIVGIRRKIIKKLRALKARVQLLQKNVKLFTPSREGVLVEVVGKQMGNFYDASKGQMKLESGGGVIIAVTVLLAFLLELVNRRNQELE